MSARLIVPGHAEKILLCADRVQRAQWAMREWAELAKTCVDFFEGRQWSAEDVAKLTDEKRPAYKWNKIRPLVRLVQGYYNNNRTDVKYQPSHDGTGNQRTAEALTKIGKQIATSNRKRYTDTSVFIDGMLTGRGYYDVRLSYAKNILGEQRVTDRDPFAIGLDPDGQTYDLNESCNFVYEGRWVSVDEVGFTYGAQAQALLSPFFGSRYRGGVPAGIVEEYEEIAPWRTFGGGSNQSATTRYMNDYLAQVYDPARKCIRLIDMQHKVPMMMRYMVDLETGHKEPVPDSFDDDRVGKMMAWLDERYWMKSKVSPWKLVRLPGHKIRWTTLVGDIIVYDKWSQYETYTLIPFFPYFRRGQTGGMVEDLIDPQKAYNKSRSAEIDIVTRTAHAGWMYHKDGLTPDGKEQIENYGAMPGVNIEWKGEQWMAPRKIEPGAPPMAMERLQQKDGADLKEISGINDSALGQLDRVQSGRAIEARQRQSVLGIEPFMDNNKQTQELYGAKTLEIVQNSYTQRRVFALLTDRGEDETLIVNDEQASGEIVNDLALGHYDVAIDQTPLSATFLAAQFEEMLELVEKGIVPVEAIREEAIDASSIPHKDAVKAKVAAINAALGIPSSADLEAAGRAGLPAPGVVAPPVAGAPGTQPPGPMGGPPGQPQPAPAMAAAQPLTAGVQA